MVYFILSRTPDTASMDPAIFLEVLKDVLARHKGHPIPPLLDEGSCTHSLLLEGNDGFQYAKATFKDNILACMKYRFEQM